MRSSFEGSPVLAACIALAAVSCRTGVVTGGPDGGATDSGVSTSDAGLDAGTRDAGFSDAGASDSGAMDAGATPTFYGSGIGADSLDNHQVATGDVDFRFRAATSSGLQSLIWYNIYVVKCAPHAADAGGTCPQNCSPSGSVYACGTGGNMHICVEPDDGTANHLATGVELSCVDHLNASGPPFFPVETFPTPAVLDAGQLYHLHWHNTDPTPAINFTSVDTLYVMDATVPRQPTISDTDLAVFRDTTLRTNDTALFELQYADGTVQGQGYMEVWIGAPVDISGPAWVRETFTVSGGDRSVGSASVRLNRASGSSPLTLTLLDGIGATLQQTTLAASAFPLGDVNTLSPTWATGAFGATQVLANGSSYSLLLTAPADTDYQAYGLERGDNYAFVPPTFFGDGYGQFSLDYGGTWQGFTQPGGSTNNTNADVQFYFGP